MNCSVGHQLSFRSLPSLLKLAVVRIVVVIATTAAVTFHVSGSDDGVIRNALHFAVSRRHVHVRKLFVYVVGLLKKVKFYSILRPDTGDYVKKTKYCTSLHKSYYVSIYEQRYLSLTDAALKPRTSRRTIY